MFKNKKFLFLCACVLVLILLPAVLFRVSGPFIKSILIEETRNATGLQLDIETLSLRFPGYVHARGVTLSDKEESSLLSAESIGTRISLPCLLRRRITLTRLFIDSLFVHDSLIEAFEAPLKENDSSGGGAFVSVKNISLKNSAFFLNGRKTEIEIARGDFTATPCGDMYILLDSVSLSGDGKQAGIQTFEASLNISGDFPAIKKMLLEAEGLRISGHMDYKQEEKEFDGYFEGEGSLETVSELAASVMHIHLPELKGNFKVLSDISGFLPSPSIAAELYFDEFSAAGREFSSLEVFALMDGSHINLSKAEITGIFGEKAFLSGTYDTASHFADHFNMKIQQAPASGSFRIPGAPEEIAEGLIDASFFFSGPADNPREWKSEGLFRLTGAFLKGKEIPGISGNFLFKESAGTLEIQSDFASIDVQVKYANPKFEGEYSLQVEKIEELLIYTGFEEITGNLKLTGSFNYSSEDFRADAEIEQARIVYNSIPASIERGNIYLDSNGFSFRDIAGRGDFIIEDSPLAAEFIPQLTGNVSYRFTAQGSAGDPQAVFEITINDPSFNSFTADGFYASGNYANSSLTFDSFSLRKGSFLVLSESSLQPLLMKGDIEFFTFKMPRRNFTEGPKLFKKAFREFEDAGRALLSFDLSREDDIYINYTEEGFNIETAAEVFELTYPMEGILKANILFSGSPENPYIQARALLEDSRINKNRITKALIDMQLEDEILTVREMELSAPRAGNIRGNFSFKARDISNGLFAPNMEHHSEGNLSIERMDITLLNFFIKEELVNSGLASATVEWHGHLKSPVAKGFLRFEDLSVIAEGEEIPGINMSASFSDRKLLLEHFSATLQGKSLFLTGNLEYPSKDHYLWDIVIKVDGDDRVFLSGELENSRINALCRIISLNLADFARYIPVENPDGRLNADIRIEGSPDSPKVYGNIIATNLAGKTEFLKHPVSGGAADILFNSNEVEIRRIFARSGRGTINAAGSIHHKNANLLSSDISLSASALELEIENMGHGIIKLAEIGYKGEEGFFVLSGEAEMTEFLITADEHSAGRGSPEEFTENIQLDLALHTGRNMWVYNRAGRIRLDGQMRLSGPAANPVLTGRIDTKEGYIMYLDRKFDLVDGYVDFDGRPENIPYIDVSARTRVRSLRQVDDRPYDITLRATGYVNDIQIYMTSSPHLEFADIVSLLTFGATRSQMTESERLLTLRAEELASTRIAGYISAYAGNMLNLDLIVIEGNVFRAGSPHGPKIQAQKSVSENIALAYVGNLSPEDSAIVARRTAGRTEITYTEGIGRTEQQKLQFRYSLTPSLAAEALTDNTGRSNIGLKYSIWMR